MNRIKKLLVTFLAVIASFALAIGVVACADEEGGVEKVTLKLAGETANASGEYSLTLTEGGNKQYTLVVGTLTDYELSAKSSDETVATATATATSLSVQAKKAGSAKITLSEKSGKANNLILNVTVEAAPVVEPTGLIISNLTEDANERTGTGTIADPYTVTVADGRSSVHTLTVQPAGADGVFTWTVGTVDGTTFTAGTDTLVTAAQSGNTLTITSGALAAEKDQDIYYIQGKAQTGELTVYIKVTVNKYVALTGITVNGLTEAPDGAEYDYVLNTAKGTNWNLDKVAGRLTSGMGKPENEIPGEGKVDYYHSVNKFSLTATPAEATDKDWIIAEEGGANIFTANPDGTWSVTGTGETVVKITNVAEEASVKIKLTVADTVYPGVLKSKYDAATAETNLDWAFDDHADDQQMTARSLLNKWYFAMNKTTGSPDGDDGNQKIFWLGGGARPYGFDLEMRLDTDTGAKVGDTLALAWTKATIPAGATTLQAIIGNNNKDFTKYRIVLVKEDGASYVISGNGWIVKESDGNGTRVEYDIPADCKGQTVAIVFEAGLTKAGENAEFHCKGVWINVPITGITLAETTTSLSRGSADYQIRYFTTPSKVIDDSVTYTVSTEVAGGDGKVTVDENGNVAIALDAPLGDYTVTVTSTVNPEATAALTITVTGYNAVTAFTGTYTDRTGTHDFESGQTEIRGKKGADAITLAFSFQPVDASVQSYTITYKDNNADTAAASSNVVAISDGKLNFAYAGTVEVTVTPDAEEAASMAIVFTVTVVEGTVLNWDGKDAILNGESENNPDKWNMTGGNRGVGEGADIHNDGNKSKESYLEKEITLTADMDTLVVYARIFAGQQGGDHEDMIMKITVGDEEIFLMGTESDRATLHDDSSGEQKTPFYFDISKFAGQTVTIRITNISSWHCVIQQITIS